MICSSEQLKAYFVFMDDLLRQSPGVVAKFSFGRRLREKFKLADMFSHKIHMLWFETSDAGTLDQRIEKAKTLEIAASISFVEPNRS